MPPEPLRHVTATRYVVPLREGGSLPAVMEADDLGTYVVKFRGAGQGVRALTAEVVTGELGRRLGLRVPELVLVEVDPLLGRAEPDEEVQDLLRASPGTNLGMDFLPGALGYDPAAADHVPAEVAAAVVWFDALVLNVDRSWRNTNLLVWHGDVWLVDHGASLYVHHDWDRSQAVLERPLRGGEDHVLLPRAGPLWEAHERLSGAVTPATVREVVALTPEPWASAQDGDRYAEALQHRLAHVGSWLPPLEEARRARV